jgi:ABC-type phosphate transport system substrate-binding protein
MTRLTRLAVGAAAAAAGLLASVPADAQEACDTLPNPIVVAGSSDFEPVLRQFAVKLAAESPPATIVTISAGGQSTSCAAVKGLVDGTDFGGLPGRYYTRNGATISTKTCLLSPGQTTQVAISDVFYESCANVPQPRPAEIKDVTGPVQTEVFVARKLSTTQYITYEEARTVYGCGISSASTVAGLANSMRVLCRDPAAGTQVTVARNIGLSESMLTAPKCSWVGDDSSLAVKLVEFPDDPDTPDVADPRAASGDLGFIAASQLDHPIDHPVYKSVRDAIKQLAFQALGQTRAFYPDSGPAVADRRNVRDGHYPIWGYFHLIAKTTNGNLSPQASELIGWINGTKTSPNVDHLALEASAGLVPQCAMKVKRASDGGLLSPYAPPQTCSCSFEALSTQATPAACVPCLSNSACACGKSCRHGFCE